MAFKKQARFGSWKSPITTDLITRGAVGLGQVFVDEAIAYWTELRPTEEGRTTLVCEDGVGGIQELLPKPFNVRSRVHEYGGGSFIVKSGKIFFVDSRNQEIYQMRRGEKPNLIAKRDKMAFADFIYDESRDCLFCVAEDHSGEGEPQNMLVSISMDGQIVVISKGADFYAAPKLSPDDKRLMWVEWHHPNMPWDGTYLYEANILDHGVLGEKQLIAGGDSESIFQPEYGPNGDIFYVSDRSGYWNIYKHGAEPRHYAFEAEFGLPHWVFGMRTYDFVDNRWIVATYAESGDWKLGLLDTKTGKLANIDAPWCDFGSLRCQHGKVYFNGGRVGGPSQIAAITLDKDTHEVLRNSAELDLPIESISVGEKIKFPSENGIGVYGYLYMPAHAEFCGEEIELPPLIVKSHGGPTGQTGRSFSLKTQYWTSRGFAVFDVNYGGSTGFGRDYRERLTKNWGVVDVDDCVNGAKFLAGYGKVDPERLIIAGGSAGGYTTLAALTFHNVFRAGCSSYGIGDLTALAEDTHKFESRYLDKLVGPWPESADLYRKRSPIHQPGTLNCPVIFLQGEDDKVVPPNQAEMMVNVLRDKKLPVSYILFEGEGHGFRKAETIKQALEAELSFYAQIFGFDLADDMEAVEIENMLVWH